MNSLLSLCTSVSSGMAGTVPWSSGIGCYFYRNPCGIAWHTQPSEQQSFGSICQEVSELLFRTHKTVLEVVPYKRWPQGTPFYNVEVAQCRQNSKFPASPGTQSKPLPFSVTLPFLQNGQISGCLAYFILFLRK